MGHCMAISFDATYWTYWSTSGYNNWEYLSDFKYTKNTHTSPLSSCYVVIVVCNMTEMTAFYSVSYDAAYIIKQGLNRTKCCLFKINIVALFDDV